MLELLSKYHSTWVTMGLKMGIPDYLVEDLIQEMYLRLDKYIKNVEQIMYNDTEPNKFYIYITLKNLWNDYLKYKSKIFFFRIDDEDFDIDKDNLNLVHYDDDTYDRIDARERIIDKIEGEVGSWSYWYDKKLFNLYYNSDMTMRRLSEETSISLTSIFNSCKNYKEIMKEKFGEDYDDYINGDYHLI